MAQLDYGTAGYHGLSYSRRATLHACPRKFQIENALGLKERTDTVTFSFGHAVAAGVQSWFQHQNTQLAILECCKHYTVSWSDAGTASEVRGKKSVWYAVHAVNQFIKGIQSLLAGGIAELANWELAYLAGHQPAVELQFRILLDHQFVYEGHIDLVLVHKTTKQFAILELKTTTFREPHDAQYGKSDQALSYSIVLDRAVGHSQSSYKVFYLIYSSSAQQWILKEFVKHAKMRLDWINNLVRDTDIIMYYQGSAESDGIPYPTNGASCYNFFRECEYYHTCDMEDASLLRIYGKQQAVSFDYTDRATFVFTLDEIISSQIAKIENSTGVELTLDSQLGGGNGQLIEI